MCLVKGLGGPSKNLRYWRDQKGSRLCYNMIILQDQFSCGQGTLRLLSDEKFIAFLLDSQKHTVQ